MPLKIVTPPSSDPEDLAVTLDEMKSQLRVDYSDDDTRITALLLAAIGYADGPDGFLGRALCDQEWDLVLDRFPCAGEAVRIPLPPLIEVVGVFYKTDSDAEQEWSASAYVVDDASEPARLFPVANGSWPSPVTLPGAVRVRFRAGYLNQSVSPAESNVPAEIKVGIMLRCQADYDGGDSADRLRDAANSVFRLKRVHTGMA